MTLFRHRLERDSANTMVLILVVATAALIKLRVDAVVNRIIRHHVLTGEDHLVVTSVLGFAPERHQRSSSLERPWAFLDHELDILRPLIFNEAKSWEGRVREDLGAVRALHPLEILCQLESCPSGTSSELQCRTQRHTKLRCSFDTKLSTTGKFSTPKGDALPK